MRDSGPFHVFGVGVNEHWSYKEFENAPVYVIDKLSRAMRQNPHLAVHFAYGLLLAYPVREGIVALSCFGSLRRRRRASTCVRGNGRIRRSSWRSRRRAHGPGPKARG